VSYANVLEMGAMKKNAWEVHFFAEIFGGINYFY
jgi:hypothetical protein